MGIVYYIVIKVFNYQKIKNKKFLEEKWVNYINSVSTFPFFLFWCLDSQLYFYSIKCLEFFIFSILSRLFFFYFDV